MSGDVKVRTLFSIHHMQVLARGMSRITCTELQSGSFALQDLVTFHSTDRQGSSVYHTNVVMAIGTDVAVVCLESVTDSAERQRLKASLSVHHEVNHFAAHLCISRLRHGACKLCIAKWAMRLGWF